MATRTDRWVPVDGDPIDLHCDTCDKVVATVRTVAMMHEIAEGHRTAHLAGRVYVSTEDGLVFDGYLREARVSPRLPKGDS